MEDIKMSLWGLAYITIFCQSLSDTDRRGGVDVHLFIPTHSCNETVQRGDMRPFRRTVIPFFFVERGVHLF